VNKTRVVEFSKNVVRSPASPVSFTRLLCPLRISCVLYTSPVSFTCLLCPLHVSCVLYVSPVSFTRLLCPLRISYVLYVSPVSFTRLLCPLHVSCVLYVAPSPFYWVFSLKEPHHNHNSRGLKVVRLSEQITRTQLLQHGSLSRNATLVEWAAPRGGGGGEGAGEGLPTEP